MGPRPVSLDCHKTFLRVQLLATHPFLSVTCFFPIKEELTKDLGNPDAPPLLGGHWEVLLSPCLPAYQGSPSRPGGWPAALSCGAGSKGSVSGRLPVAAGQVDYQEKVCLQSRKKRLGLPALCNRLLLLGGLIDEINMLFARLAPRCV